MRHDLVIVGGGPAGYTAAIYAARSGLNPVVYEGTAAGGQLMLTTEVENYPGFPAGVEGPTLMSQLRQQAERFGADIRTVDVEDVDLSESPFVLKAAGEEVTARTLIWATGASARWLGIPGEERLLGRGVSACATCDGWFFRDKNLIVVGGGDTAAEEALYLTRFAREVTLIHRRDQLRASAIMAERVLEHPNITVLWNRRLVEIEGETKVERVVTEDTVTGEQGTLETNGVFVAIGHQPNTALVASQVECDESGYIVVDHPTTSTSVPGFFAAGDVADPRYRQAITAAGSGCRAAIDAYHYLESH